LGLTDAVDPGATVAGWSDDGRKLYVSTGKDVPAQIHQIDVATGQRSLLIELAPTDRIGMFLMTPFSVSKSGAEYAYSYVRRLSTLFVVDPLR
jgi:hypothetical protein